MTSTRLESFSDILARFLEKLEEEWHTLVKADKQNQPEILTSVRWELMAVINISAVLEYGNQESVIRKALQADAAYDNPSKTTSAPPQAIMLNPVALAARPRRLSDASESSKATEGTSATDDEVLAEEVRKLEVTAPLKPPEPPLAFVLAQRLMFGLLAFSMRHLFKPRSVDPAISPYTTLTLTFLCFLAQHKEALKLVQQYAPWPVLAALFNQIPRGVELRADPPTKLLGQPLPEDWCIRGMEWTGRNLFGRGYWKQRPSNRAGVEVPLTSSSAFVDGEVALLEAELEELLLFDSQRDVMVESEETAASGVGLALARWKRLANCAASLCKTVPGLLMDLSPRSGPRFKVLPSLATKVTNWSKEEAEAAQREQARLRARQDKEAAERPPPDSDAEERSDGEGDKQTKVRFKSLMETF